MRIETVAMHKFFFNYEGTELMIPVSAPTQEEAKIKLRDFFLKWSSDLVMPFGAMPSPFASGPNSASTSGISVGGTTLEPPKLPQMALELRIEELVKELVAVKKPKGAQPLEKLVADWTGFAMKSQNYASIISELERIKNGPIN